MFNKALIQLESVTKDYSMGEVTVHALRGLDLEIQAEEFVVLLGPSGSGKTTVLNLIGGLDHPTAGHVFVQSEDIARYDEKQVTEYRRRKVGFVFQFFNLVLTLTAAENVEFALARLDGGRNVRAKALELPKLVGLQQRADHFPSQMSGGEQQVAGLRLDYEGYREIAGLMPTLILLVAAGSVYVMLGRQVRAQRPQIGLMKAIGYSTRTVGRHYLVLALIIGVIGSVLGLAVSIPLEYGITSAYADELGIPLVQAHFYVDLAALGVLLSLVVVTLAGLGPARGAARLAPALAMRLDPGVALTPAESHL